MTKKKLNKIEKKSPKSENMAQHGHLQSTSAGRAKMPEPTMPLMARNAAPNKPICRLSFERCSWWLEVMCAARSRAGSMSAGAAAGATASGGAAR